MTDVSVLGAGAFGTAAAAHPVPDAAEVARKGENATYLPGFPVPPEVLFTNDMATALQDADLVLLVVPSGFMRSVTKQAAPHLPRGALITSTAKGIEEGSLALMSDVLAETLPDHAGRATYLSGPLPTSRRHAKCKPSCIPRSFECTPVTTSSVSSSGGP